MKTQLKDLTPWFLQRKHTIKLCFSFLPICFEFYHLLSLISTPYVLLKSLLKYNLFFTRKIGNTCTRTRSYSPANNSDKFDLLLKNKCQKTFQTKGGNLFFIKLEEVWNVWILVTSLFKNFHKIHLFKIINTVQAHFEN